VRLGDLQIRKQCRDGLARHRRASVGMNDLRGPMDSEDHLHHLHRQLPGFRRVDMGADDVAGVNIDHHHVAVKILPLDGPGKLCDVPGVDLPGTGGDQFRDRPGRIPGQPAAFLDLLVLRQHR
jgi:hypothetical protein